MKMVLNIITLCFFVAAYYAKDMYYATMALMACSLIALALQYFLQKLLKTHLNWEDFLTVITIWALGSVTLWAQNDIFIKLKPTCVCCALSLIILCSRWFYSFSCFDYLCKNTLSSYNPESPTFTENDCMLADYLTVIFYTTLGITNIFIVYHCSTSLWLFSKTIGFTLINIIYSLILYTYLSKRNNKHAYTHISH